jgi:hypothetical protein
MTIDNHTVGRLVLFKSSQSSESLQNYLRGLENPTAKDLYFSSFIGEDFEKSLSTFGEESFSVSKDINDRSSSREISLTVKEIVFVKNLSDSGVVLDQEGDNCCCNQQINFNSVLHKTPCRRIFDEQLSRDRETWQHNAMNDFFNAVKILIPPIELRIFGGENLIYSIANDKTNSEVSENLDLATKVITICSNSSSFRLESEQPSDLREFGAWKFNHFLFSTKALDIMESIDHNQITHFGRFEFNKGNYNILLTDSFSRSDLIDMIDSPAKNILQLDFQEFSLEKTNFSNIRMSESYKYLNEMFVENLHSKDLVGESLVEDLPNIFKKTTVQLHPSLRMTVRDVPTPKDAIVDFQINDLPRSFVSLELMHDGMELKFISLSKDILDMLIRNQHELRASFKNLDLPGYEFLFSNEFSQRDHAPEYQRIDDHAEMEVMEILEFQGRDEIRTGMDKLI